jgi:hypothetical protein
MPITDELLDALNNFEHKSQGYFFWTSNGRRRSHAFRATLVDGVLSLRNGTMEDAQILLGFDWETQG